MEITRFTSIEDLVPTEEVITEMLDMQLVVNANISSRKSLLNTHKGSSYGLNSSVLVDGEPLFYNDASDIEIKYTAVEDTLDTLVTSICNATINQELDELDRLWTEVETTIQECNTEIKNFEARYEQEKVSKASGMLTSIMMVGGVAGTTGAVAGFAEVYEKYYGTSGLITIKKYELEKWEAKQDKIQTRIQTVSAMINNYSSVTTDNESVDTSTTTGSTPTTNETDVDVADPTDASPETQTLADGSELDQSNNNTPASVNIIGDTVEYNGNTYEYVDSLGQDNSFSAKKLFKSGNNYYYQKNNEFVEVTPNENGIYIIDGEEWKSSSQTYTGVGN